MDKEIDLYISDINEGNVEEKLQKAIKRISDEFNIPVTVKLAENSKKEEFPFKANEEIYEQSIKNHGLLMDELYSRVCRTLEINPVNTFSKAINPDARSLLKNTIMYNPETGRRISEKDMVSLVEAIDKFLNRNNPTKEIILNQSTVSRILAQLRGKGVSFDDLRIRSYDSLYHKNKKAATIAKDFSSFRDSFPEVDYSEWSLYQRNLGNYIQNVNDKTKQGIRDILTQGMISGKPNSEISQDLFDKFGNLNKDWQMIMDTEQINIANYQYIDSQVEDLKPGEKAYFIRREFGDAKTCSFCKQAVDNKIIALYVENPRSSEEIEDPIASIAIWPGKSNFSVKRDDWQWASGVNHPNCYSDDTEVLTDTGWKLFKDVLPLDKIMSINPETREIDYLNHKGLISYQYDGEMIHFDGLSYDMLVTPDHRCLYKKSGKGKSLQVTNASNLLNTDFMTPRGIGLWYGFDHDIERIAETCNMDVRIYSKLWGWFLSEGNVRFNKHRSEVKITQKVPENVISDIGCDPRFRISKEAVYIYDRKVVSTFSDYCGVHAEQKYIPDFIRNSSKEIIQIFLDSFQLGDGSTTISTSPIPEFGSSQQNVIRTSSPKMMSQLCELIVKTERICSVYKYEQKGKPVKHRNGTYITKTDCYNINIMKSKFRHYHKVPRKSKVTGTYSKELQQVQYSGKVYDVELIKWHFLLVKRNGKLAWSGNCRGSWDRYYSEHGDLDFSLEE